MKQQQIRPNLARVCQRALSFLFFVMVVPALAQSDGWLLEKFPPGLETELALSSMPPHVRDAATVYLLDPKKGYYVARQGSNGFVCFVIRTEWDRGEFRQDLASPISYDAEGARSIFPVYADAAALRATGKLTAIQLRDTIAQRFEKGIYKAPARTGISYMLAPVMRTYEGSSSRVMTMSVPHYMFYAPYITEADIGGNSKSNGAFVLGDGKSPHEYIIVPAGEMEKAQIVRENESLLKRLTEYRPYFSVGQQGSHHGN